MNIIRKLTRSSARLSRIVKVSPSGFSTKAAEIAKTWADAEEPLEDYVSPGYLPIAIGDVLGTKYRIVNKLGWGVYSTVWLVQQRFPRMSSRPVFGFKYLVCSDGPFAALKVLGGAKREHVT